MNAAQRQHPDESRDRPRRKRLDAATRRETILDVAIPMFAAAGYEQTRMSDVATRVGVTEPVIFQNFGSKAELFVAALERAASDATRYLTAIAAEYPDVEARDCHKRLRRKQPGNGDKQAERQPEGEG